MRQEFVLPKTWRSEWRLVVTTLFFIFAALKLTSLLPWSVIKGEVFYYGTTRIFLHLPLFWLAPVGSISLALYRIYNVRYSLTPEGITSKHGILALTQIVSQIRFEDIRAAEVLQSIPDRILNIGVLEISTSATGGIDVFMEGIAKPHVIQDAILAERDKRQMFQVRQGMQSEQK